jgi:molybdenum cofactor biosynthesis protein B
VSDTRTDEDDRSGAAARRLLVEAGHEVVDRSIVPDDPAQVRARLTRWIDGGACDVIVSTGGTGIAPRDRTYEAVVELLDRRLDGFGELFRMLSWEQVGSAAMLSRAVGGVARGTAIFALPGSTKAVELALERLIVPELGHLVAELRRPSRPSRQD